MQPNNNPNKKRIIYIIIAILVVIVITVVTVFVLNSFKVNNNSNTNNQTTNTKADAGALMAQAIQFIHSDPTKAKTLLEQARAEYLKNGDKTGVVNVDSQLYLIAHPIVSK